MTTVVQTEPGPEEIAEIVGMDGLDAAAAEAEAAALTEAEAPNEAAAPVAAEVDLDDQTSTMGDSVHTYLTSIGRTSLLTAEQEVNLAKRIEAGLYAEHKLETEPDLAQLRAAVRQRMPSYAAPKALILVTELPLLPSGKPDLAAIRALGREFLSDGRAG